MAFSAAAASESDSARRPNPVVPAVPGTSRHIGEIDGLRAFAIWSVLLGHLLTVYRNAPVAAPLHAFFVVADHGWLGVDLFFVLSGFLITSILLRARTRSLGRYFKQFYRRRAARILPVYAVVLLVLFAAYQGRYGGYFALCALMSANLAQLFPIKVPDAAGPFWSLAVEEQFYLVWPWLVLWLDPRRLALVAGGLIVLEPALRMFATPGKLTLPWFRLDGLAVGALVALWYATWDGERAQARTVALAFTGAAVAVTVAGLPFGVLHDGVAGIALRITQAALLFGAALVAVIGFSGDRRLAFLRSPFTTTTALLSYCLYLIHKPLIDAFLAVVGPQHWYHALAPLPAFLLQATIVLSAAYLLAAFSRKYIEAPFMRLASRAR